MLHPIESGFITGRGQPGLQDPSSGFVAAGVASDTTLLAGETDGFAIDFTEASPMVQIRTSGVDAFEDPATFFTQAGDAKYVKDSATTIASEAFPISYGQGLLVEPAATNILLNSADFSNASWTKQNCTISTNATTAPDGTSTADKIVTDNAVSACGFYSDHALAAATIYTYSVFAKAAEWSWLNIRGSSDAFPDNERLAWFNLGAGTVGTTQTNVTGRMTLIGDGWYLCEATMTTDAGSGSASSGFLLATNSDNALDTGDGTSGIHLWGAQCETGSIATSYIPTAGSPVTRDADDVSALVSTIPWSATEGTVYVDYTPSVPTGTQVVWHVDDGTGDERIYLYRATNDPSVHVIDGGVAQLAPLDLGTITGGARSQTTFAWKVNDFAGSHGGAAIVADTGGTIPTMTTFRLGTDQGASQLNGLIRRIIWVPRRVSDGDLPAWRYE
jgi:hypothetical protein